MRVLVVNCGSSSVKCQVFELPAERSLARAVFERVGHDNARLRLETGEGPPHEEERPCPSHRDAIERILALLQDPAVGGVSNLGTVDAVGHRVVHAGEAFTGSVPVTDEVMAALEACSDLAPLHNPPNLAGIRACRAILPDTPQVAVFDNALHHTLAPEIWHYGLPLALHEQHRIRQYGFHGVAFRSMTAAVEQALGRDRQTIRLVNLMLGSGCTANAMAYGRSVAVSTGFTPLPGLVQSTRTGDLDPGIVLALLQAGRAPADLNNLLNRDSGLLGLSGVGTDMRDIERAAAGGDERAAAALDVFVHRLVKYVGAYTADMEGLDALAFGGGIGQNSAAVRARVCASLSHLGVRLDPQANESCRGTVGGLVSAADSDVAVVVAAVDEELVIASDTSEVVGT